MLKRLSRRTPTTYYPINTDFDRGVNDLYTPMALAARIDVSTLAQISLRNSGDTNAGTMS